MARILHGRPAEKGTNPWIAMLSHPNGQPFCGGSLLGKERVEGEGDPGLGAREDAKGPDPLSEAEQDFFIENHCPH